MSKLSLSGLLGRLRRLTSEFDADASDGALLARFAAARDEAAFAEIVRRHGPMVLGVARTMVGDTQGDDVFQAAFMVLARKASSLGASASVGGWMYEVTCRIALQARADAARRNRHESQFMSTRAERIEPEPPAADVAPVLYEELRRLPEKYRQPVVLCYLEGLTNEEAARKLGWPVGTVKVRIARARDLLRGRLARRGLALSLAAIAATLEQAHASASSVPVVLAEVTIKASIPFAAGAVVRPELLSPTAATFAHGVLKSMILRKLITMAAVVVLPVIVGGAGLVGYELGRTRVAAAPSAEQVPHEDAGPAAPPSSKERPQPPPKKERPPRPPVEAPRPPLIAPAKKPAEGSEKDVYPRRLLAIYPGNYLYMNPVSHGPTHELVGRLGAALHVPEEQLVELSDAAPDKLARPPLKDVAAQAIRDFATTSRAQDRIVLLFSGHALDIDGKAFLAPLEAEAEDLETLIPLDWVYEQLSRSKARQKVLILDVCRRDPSRDTERPDGGSMSGTMEEAMSHPPDGVQVWSACATSQYSYEEGARLHGGIFLHTLVDSLATKLPASKPEESIPVAALSKRVDPQVELDADFYVHHAQTPRFFGSERAEGAAYNPREKRAEPVKIQWAEGEIFGAATKDEVARILAELGEIPPLKLPRPGVRPVRADVFPIFARAVMKQYVPDEHDTPFRDAIKKAIAVLKKQGRAYAEEFAARDIERLKLQIQPVQRQLAVTKLELDEALSELDNVAELRKEEKSLRWQAMYDYVLARMLLRVAYTFEYAYVLSEIRTDALPALSSQHAGWRLASCEKMSCKGDDGKEAKVRVKKARELLEKVIKAHKGTPYEILAKRELRTAVGLQWRPYNDPGKIVRK